MSDEEKLKQEVLEIRKWLYGDKAPEYQEYTVWYEPSVIDMSKLFNYIDLLEQARAELIEEVLGLFRKEFMYAYKRDSEFDLYERVEKAVITKLSGAK